MNKNLYRIVFNRARGMLMVVPEIARAIGTRASGTGHTLSRLIGKVSALSFSLWLALGAVQTVQADIIANGAAAKNQRPTIISSANGTPQVNIQTPSNAGVSRNSFSRFDVDKKGVILNNAARNTQSELAGMVAANPWLARGEAKVILNEVSSRDPSKLNGIIEVAGKKAQVVIANPAGITCDGCGFINANRTTLTTGQVQMSDGKISGYDVQRGEIVIEGRGMDSTRADSTDLIARAVKVNAGLWAKELKVSTGRNIVDAAHQAVTAKNGDESSRPQFTLDVAQLGGMYASKIHLRGTERGLGVRNAGMIGASAGDVVVNADGTLTNSGQIQAQETIHLSSRSGIQSSGVLAAGIKPDGSANATGNLTLTSEGTLKVSGQNQAAGKISARGADLNFSASQSSAAQIELMATQGNIRTAQASTEARTVTVRTGGKLDNDGGNITADTLDITARQLSNREGVLQQRGEAALTLAHQDGIDNRGGIIANAGEKLTLTGASLDNQQGRIQANALAIDTATRSINNQQGILTASREMMLHSGGLNNDAGLVQAGSALNIDLHGGALSNRDSGENGGLLSFGTFTLSGGTLDNRSGYMASAGDSLINGLALDNTLGTLYSESHLSLTTDALVNRQGLIQAGNNLTLETRGQTLINNQGRISAGQNLVLQSGALNNQSGHIVAGDAMTLTTQASPLNNQQGILAAGGEMRLESSELGNQSGQIQSAGDMTLAVGTQLDNSAGLIRSGKTTTLNARSLLNRNTARENRGIEGDAVILNAPVLDNSDGAIRSNDTLIVNTLTLLDNTRGLLSSAGELDVRGGKTLALTNTGGTLIAGRELKVNAASASGDGKLLSQDALQLNLQKAFVNTGEIIANGNVTFTLAKGLTNENLIKAGKALTITAKNLTNKVNAGISAGENHLLIEGTLTNRGLLDGGLTHLTAATLNNYGTGRIYGDHLALAAATINNEAKKGVAPVIAAREWLDIAAGTINNKGHALIYSAGDMAMGGNLNAQYEAQGQAQTLNNTGATIEAAGNMFLGVATINNTNAGMKTKVVVVENSDHHEVALKGSTNRFDRADVFIGDKDKWDVHQATMPDGTKGREFYEYKYKREVKETQVTETDPGKIIAGGNIHFNSRQVNNQDSQIVAGGLLGGIIGELNNLATTGVRITTDIGTQIRWYAKKKKRRFGGTKTSQGKKYSDYAPAPVTQTIDLKQMAWQSHTQNSGSGATIASRNTEGMTTGTARAGTTSPALPGQIMEIGGGENSVIRITPPDLRLPDNSLFRLHLNTDVPYLIETDPRFTDRRTWLGSDYMQRQFKLDGNNMLKRLGDGFYEQRLIREQVIQLTGNRYLQGFSNDEEQFRALMDAGVAFGHQYHLVPGVALTAEQMAHLTSDIVWLVQQEIPLKDGTTQRVLVPQVYAKVKPGDLDAGGALLTGNEIVLDLKQDLTNSGRISGRDVTQITAESLTNTGFIGGRNVALEARTDINNLGGTLQGNDSLSLMAGRDINSVTTTQGDAANRWVDRPAAIFVQSDSGDLSLQALNNISLTGSQVSNAGADSRTRIAAGNDLTLDTVSTARTEYGNWGKGNSRLLEQSSDVGSQINGGGDVVLQSGHDLNARAASVTARDDLIVAAGNNVTLTSGESSSHLEEHSRQSTSGMLSKKTTVTHDEIWQTTAQGSLLSGDNVTVQAGNDLLIHGSSVAGEGDIALQAGHDVTIEAATHTRADYHMEKTRKSGVFGSGSGVGVTVGSQSTKTTRQGTETTQSDARSLVGTSGGNVIIRAGEQVTLSAADVVAGRAEGDTTRATGHIDITGRDIAVLPGRDTLTESMKQETRSSGLTVSVKAPFEDSVRNVRDALSSKGGNSTVDRVKALAAEGAALGLDGPGNMVTTSFGSSKSTQESHYEGEFSSGSKLNAAGNIQMNATGNDLVIAGSQLQAGESVILDAHRDIRITTSTDREAYNTRNSQSGWMVTDDISMGSTVRATGGGGQHGNRILPGGMSQSEGKTSGASITQNASLIEGRDIYLNSREGSIDVSGSRLSATDDLMLSATQGDVRITAGQDTARHDASGSSKTVGTLGSDGYGGTVGYGRDSYRTHEASSLESGLRSQLNSTEGNVIVQAGKDIALSGTDVAAGKSVTLTGENVLLDVSRDTRDGASRSSQTQYGVTASAGGWAVDAAKSAENAARSAENGDDPRLTAIRAGQAGATAVQGAMTDSSVVKAKVSLTAGSSSQQSEYHSADTQGTTLRAGEEVNIRARNDIVGEGVQIDGRRVTLDAGRDILMTASQDTLTRSSRSQGNQVGIGVGFSLIGGQNGFSIELGASQQSGRENGSSAFNSNSLIRADELLSVTSGRDTTLRGAELSGNRVEINTGRDLTVSSVQDSVTLDSKNSASGVGLSLCIPPICYGASTASVSLSGDNITHEGQSVANQSAIRAGSGGFDITTGNHTQLDGAVISSTAADKNRLDTGTLGWRDLENRSTTSGDSYSVALSGSGKLFGGNDGMQLNVAPAIGTGHAGSEDSGTTRSAISDGEIILRNPEGQTQDIAGLSRDTENTHDGVDIRGDIQQVKDDLAVQSEAAALGTTVLDAYSKYAQKQAAESNAALEAKLASEGKLDGLTAAQREAVIRSQPEYNSTDYGPGSAFWTKGSAAAGLLAGALGGNMQAGAAAGAAPLLASLVKNVENDAARAALHGIVAAALTQLAGGSGADGMKAGAAGAVTASLLSERLVSALYGKDVSQLTADEKSLVSNLVTLAGAGVGYAAGGGDVSLAAVGANTARVEVENNSMAGDKGRESLKESKEWWKEQIREQLGENTVSQIANGLVNAAAETGDFAMLSGDTAFDIVAALTTCATEGSYCSQAQSDIAKKDAAAAKVLNSIVNGDAWEGIKTTVVKAWNGDQKALENVAGTISGALAQAKTLPGGKSTATTPAGKGTTAKLSYVEEPPFNPSGTAGAAQPWSIKGRINYVQLPNEGKIRYVPPEGYSASQPLPRGPNNGYIDRFGNEWVKGPSRTAGQAFEWDVQLSRTGKAQLGWATRDGSHLNISLDGRITHK